MDEAAGFVFNQESVDDPLIPDGMANFGKGMDGTRRVSELEKNQSELHENAYVLLEALAETIPGIANLGGQLAASRIQGGSFFKSGGTELIMAACNQALRTWDGASLATISGWTATDANVLVDFAQLGGYMYFCDGFLNLFRSNGGAAADLGTGLNTQPKIFEGIFPHGTRLIGWERLAEVLYASDLGTGVTWDNTTQIRTIGNGTGDYIVGAGVWNRNLVFVGKRDTSWVVDADAAVTPTSWAINRISQHHGLVARRGFIPIRGDVWFFAGKEGILSAKQTLNQDEREVGEDAISWPISKYVARCNWDYAYKSTLTYARGFVLFSFPIDDATEPNITFFFSTLLNCWVGYRLNWTPTCWIRPAFNANKRVVFGDSEGYLQQWREYVPESSRVESDYQDNGADVPTKIRGRALTYRLPINEKVGNDVELEFFRSQAECTVKAIYDQSDEHELFDGDSILTYEPGPDLAIPELPFDLPSTKPARRTTSLLHLGAFREQQFEIESASNRLSVRSILATALAETQETKEKKE